MKVSISVHLIVECERGLYDVRSVHLFVECESGPYDVRSVHLIVECESSPYDVRSAQHNWPTCNCASTE